jgi:hypothetical protein
VMENLGCKSSILSLVSSTSLCLCAGNMFWEVNFSVHGGGALLRAQHDYNGEGRRLPVHHVQLRFCAVGLPIFRLQVYV